jgi:hypothetical protein
MKCGGCKVDKQSSDFYKDSTKPSGLTSYCKPCSKAKRSFTYLINKDKEKEQMKTYHSKNKHKAKDKYLQVSYGITLEDFQSLSEEQNHSCWICNTEVSKLKRGLFVDHCHTTGKVRGLLCHPCNTLLGMAKDNVDILNKAIQYLQKA